MKLRGKKIQVIFLLAELKQQVLAMLPMIRLSRSESTRKTLTEGEVNRFGHSA